MSKNLRFFKFIVLSIFISCAPQESKKGNQGGGVDIKTQGIFDPVTMEIVGGTDLGEIVTGDDPSIIDVIITNNSSYPITNMNFVLDEQSSMAMKFNPDEEGKSFSPGVGGNCGSTLGPRTSCLYKIFFNPILSGYLEQDISFEYKNLVNAAKYTEKMTVLTGEAASLIHTNETQNYDYGVQERTDQIKYVKFLEIKNAGGLTAKNMNFTQFPFPDSGAFNIINNTCPENLNKGASCTFQMEWTPKNYDPPGVVGTAPDGNVDLTYTNALAITYERDPKANVSTLSANFAVLSTTIEAKMKTGGLPNVEFSVLPVGNLEKKTIKVVNEGYKEAIMHYMDFRDNSGNVIARCVKDAPGTDLVCKDPTATTPLTLPQLPFKVTDKNNCINEYSRLGYTRNVELNEDGEEIKVLSDPTLLTVAGKDGPLPGESCFFDITFHPSVEYKSMGNWNDTQIIFVYDSTWKNNIVMYNDDPTDPPNFTIAKAEYFPAAELKFQNFKFGPDNFNNLCEYTKDTVAAGDACNDADCIGTSSPDGSISGTTTSVSPNKNVFWDSSAQKCYEFAGTDVGSGNSWTEIKDVFVYDLGRLALISCDAYRQQLEFEILNYPTGANIATIVSIKDGNTANGANTITDTPQDLNNEGFSYPAQKCFNSVPEPPGPFYQDANHSNCTILSPSGKCNVSMFIAPVASTTSDAGQASAEETDRMFDVTNGFPDQYKEFYVTYKDGTTYEDDMSPRADRVIKMRIRSLLVKKGFLVFEDTTNEGGIVDDKVLGDQEYVHLKLKNVGTGPIPFIEIDSDEKLDGTARRSNNKSWPFKIVDRPTTGENGADKDCFELITFDGSSPPDTTFANAVDDPGISSLDPSKSCSLTIEMKLRDNDRVLIEQYQANTQTTRPEFHRFFDLELDGNEDDDNFITDGTLSGNDKDNNTRAGWEYNADPGNDSKIKFWFYDGDGVSTGPEYIPQLDKYGNKYVATGGVDGSYDVKINYKKPAKLIPWNPTPMMSGVIYRPPITLPQIIPDLTLNEWELTNEWGAELESKSIPKQYIVSNISSPAQEPAGYANTKGKAHVTAYYETSSYEYTYHGGTHVIGSNPSYGFLLKKLGQKSAKNVTIDTSALPVGEITMTSPTLTSFDSLNGDTQITFNYTPNAAGVHDSYITISYENQSRLLKKQSDAIDTSDSSSNYKKRVVKIKIRVIFEAVEADGNDVAIEMNSFDVQYNNGAPEEEIDETVTPVTSTFLSAAGADTITFKAIKGSPVYVKRKFTFTNNSATNTVEDFIFTLKKNVNQTSASLEDNSIGVSTENNSCNSSTTIGTNLAPGDSCSVEVKFLASGTAQTETNVAHLSYRLASNQYTAKMFNLTFEANPPASLKKQSGSPIIVNDDGNNIEAYPVEFGAFSEPHIILDNYPSDVSQPPTNPFTIVNTSSTKASFLKQYEEHVGGEPPEGQAWTEIFNNSKIAVEANRACFYGDDEASGPDNPTWGFNGTSTQCQMRVFLTLQEQYLGETLPDDENLIELKFYNNERNQFDSIYLAMQGFVEPNRSNQANQNLTNINVGSGSISFEWNPLTEQNPNWGAISGYRVFYGTNTSLLSNVFNGGGFQTIDTVTPSLSLSNLTQGTFYYFKITALRTTPGGKQYVSDSNMPIVEFVIPPDNTFYDPINNALIDKSLQDGTFTKDEAIDHCETLNHILSRNGANITPERELIDSNIWNVLLANPDESDYLFSQTSLHWMADNPVSIAPFFPGYQCTDTSGQDFTDNEIFEKSCENCTCDTLSLVRGSDGFVFPENTKYYADGDALEVGARCWLDLNKLPAF